MKTTDRTIPLRPSWKSTFWLLFWGLLLLPLAGTGLILFWFAWRKRNRTLYLVRDKSITIKRAGQSDEIQIQKIREVTIRQTWIDRKLNVGDLELSLESGKTLLLEGQENPGLLSDMIRHAARAEQKRHAQQEEREARTPDYSPGVMDKMDYLTGIWQQGLISDEEYRKERKHFE